MMQLIVLIAFCILNGVFGSDSQWGGLYPKESPTREVKSLDGMWNFRIAPLLDPEKGFREKWFESQLAESGPTRLMPVPSSYNDVTEDKELRDHIGWAWYDRQFYVPSRWLLDQRIVIRFGSLHYNSIIYINGVKVATHEGGHLPIMAEISSYLLSHQVEHRVTVAINNTLTPLTIPQGEIIHKNDPARYPAGYFTQKLDFDFTNYAGIHRPVYLYTTPKVFIEDIIIKTDIQGTDGIVKFNVTAKGATECSAKVYDNLGAFVSSEVGCQTSILIKNAKLWWPYLMSDEPGYQYTLKVGVYDSSGTSDIYHQKFGIRTLGWNSTTLTINGKPMYLRGMGKHEDSDIRGKGVDNALIVKDFSLLKWLGANSFRTSHYPYAEEIMDMADHEGIMVVDESPAVGLNGFGTELMNKHISVMEEYVRRDKNRPSVIMWSVGNEPQSQQSASEYYFRSVVSATKHLDPTRPVTCVLNHDKFTEFAGKSLDVILVNRYYSWYQDTGHLEVIKMQTVQEFTEWHQLHNVPVMISEYGAGSVAGFHQNPSFTWSEEYQAELMIENFKAFDDLRNKGFFAGEMIWNFADFATPQEYNRPGACMKGLFTRQRQPKMAGHVMRWRYWSLAKEFHNCSIPVSLFNLVNL